MWFQSQDLSLPQIRPYIYLRTRTWLHLTVPYNSQAKSKAEFAVEIAKRLEMVQTAERIFCIPFLNVENIPTEKFTAV